MSIANSTALSVFLTVVLATIAEAQQKTPSEHHIITEESEPPAAPEFKLTLSGTGAHQWRGRFDISFPTAQGWETRFVVEGQRDFFDLYDNPKGEEVLRLGAFLRRNDLGFGIEELRMGAKANLYSQDHVVHDLRGEQTLVDIAVMARESWLPALQMELGLNSEWSGEWNHLALASLRRDIDASLFGSDIDVGRLDLRFYGAVKITGTRYRHAVHGLALYHPPSNLPLIFSSLYFIYAYTPGLTFGDGNTPFDRIGRSKASEVSGFRKGIWSEHLLGIGWGVDVELEQGNFLQASSFSVGGQFMWSPDDGVGGEAGTRPDAIPTGWRRGVGDVAYTLWWIEVAY